METKTVPPPSNIAAERTLIGCLLMDDKQLDDVVGMLKPEHFYDLTCQTIYKTILQFWKENKPLSKKVLLGIFSLIYNPGSWADTLLRKSLG